MEIWDLYDKDRQLLENKMVRGNDIKENQYHLVIHVCIFNKEGEMLIQKRTLDKEGWPGAWDVSVGGSAIQTENHQRAAERETFEELGVKLDLKKQRPHLTINFEKGFDDFFIINKEIDISQLTFPTEEVDEIKWATKDEIIEMINKEIFIPYKKSMIELLFDMKGTPGGFM
ncbi:NUDIX hydrolase [Mammaliicoccus lentus]|uniref:NUDIX domain-containing protein n=1 Tax=Mammaliicoccus lentus TaxID=42858 RepID=A0ABS6GYY6_MAMLE|nr:NUDIX domain-containing protein [Mammaliicoccus lentus]MBU6113541.1 NUDIX domain-containing protein [Mammaliicoccus lentus]